MDQYGVPRFRIEYQIGENERKMSEEMYDTCEAILKHGEGGDHPLPARRSRSRLGRRSTNMGRAAWVTIRKSGAERLLPDARREECVRGGWIGIHHREREESHADDSGAGVARYRLSGG